MEIESNFNGDPGMVWEPKGQAGAALPSAGIKDAEGVNRTKEPVGSILRQKDGKLIKKMNNSGLWQSWAPGQIDAWQSQQQAGIAAGGGVQLPQQANPTDFASQAARDAAAASAATSSTIPELPNQQKVDDILFGQGAPATPPVAPPQATQPVVPPVAPPVAGQPATATPVTPQAGQPQTAAPATDVIGEVNTTFKSGTPEQKAVLRKKMKSPDHMSSLEAKAKAGDVEAYNAISALASEVSPDESVAGAIIDAKKDGKGAVADLRKRKAAGVLTDMSYTAAIIDNGKRPAKQVYEEAAKSGKSNHAYAEQTALRAMWDDMGMFDANPVVRAFQSDPTKEDVIKHAMMKGEISREKAEDWYYKQMLGRNYAGWVQKKFEDKLTGNSVEGKIAKQDKKRDAWTPNTK
jgi:hypothetical protein